MEGVRRVGVHHELRRLGRRIALGTRLRQRRLHPLHRVQRNARVGRAVQAQHRPLQLRRQFHRVLRRQRRAVAHQAPVPGHTGLHLRVVRRVQPSLAPAPAEAGHAQLVGIAAVGRDPGHRGVQVAQHLRIGHLRDHLAHQLGHLAIALRIALAHEQLGRDGQIARLGKAPRRVGDVLVHAEDLRQHQHHRQPRLARRLRAVGGHLEAGHVDHHLARRQPLGRGLDGRLRHDRQRGRGIARAQAQLERGAARGRQRLGRHIEQRLGVENVVGLQHLIALLCMWGSGQPV